MNEILRQPVAGIALRVRSFLSRPFATAWRAGCQENPVRKRLGGSVGLPVVSTAPCPPLLETSFKATKQKGTEL